MQFQRAIELNSWAPVADPEANLGGGVLEARRAEWGRVREGSPPPVGGGSGGLPRENFDKMKQNGAAFWSANQAFKLTKTKLHL